jgi:hypothetical protein
MRKIIEDHIKTLESELIDHAAKFPADNRSAMFQWRSDFERIRANIERLQFARGLIPPTGGSYPLNMY